MASKKRRNARTSSGSRKLRSVRQIKQRGHAQSRRYGGDLIDTSIIECEEGRRQFTFEDEYTLFRKTRGRSGLDYNPSKRLLNTPHGSTFKKMPIGELMSKPISKYHHHGK